MKLFCTRVSHLNTQVSKSIRKYISADGAGEGYLKCGVIDGVFPTVDFGAASDGDVKKYFEIQQKFSKGGLHSFTRCLK